MKIKLFNSLKNEITELQIERGKEIKIYLCGPTVYDHVHLGNMRSVIIFDVLKRLLTFLEMNVKYVQNITDIDDKIIKRAKKEGKTEEEISQHFTKAYFQNLYRFNILSPDHSPKVTEFIPQISKFVEDLKNKKSAYTNGKEILFSIEKFKEEYGRLSGQNLKELISKRKIINNKEKDNLDFVL
jgi:cysteinyl-tRNA synthetase